MIKTLERNTKQFFLDKFAKSKHLPKIEKIKSDRLVLCVMAEDDYKTKSQNSTFHKLLSVYFESGVSSYKDETEMRLKFKKLAGLVEPKKLNISDALLHFLRECYKILPNNALKEELGNLINFGSEKELSWSYVKKDKASFAINQLINEMYDAEVRSSQVGKEFESIVSTIER